MRIKRVKVTQHEDGWKGTWYKTGQEHFVVEYRALHLAQAYHAVRLCGGIKEADCVELTDVFSRLLCLIEWVRIAVGCQKNYAAHYC